MAKIKAVSPVVTPAVSEQAFDHYWMRHFNCHSDPNGQTRVNAQLVSCRDDVDGDGNPIKVLGNDKKNINVPDVFARIEAEPAGLLAQAFNALISAIIAEDADFTTEA